MDIIAQSMLIRFWKRHADAEQPLKAWYREVSKAAWRTPQDIKAMYPSASFLADNRVVFNIGGNNYRLIVSVWFSGQRVFIKFIGTHAEYDRIAAATVEFKS